MGGHPLKNNLRTVYEFNRLKSVFQIIQERFRSLTWLILIVGMTCASPSAWSSEPLVDIKWLNDHLDSKAIRIVDLRPASAYMQGHIPGAVNTPYGRWRQTDKKGIPGMIPSKSYLEKLVGSLGIDNNFLVILVPPGRHAGDLAIATRIYWTFNVLGHDAISILNGGMAAYVKGYPSQLERKEVRPVPTNFTAVFRSGEVPDSKEVKKALESGVPLVDSRSPGEYMGSFRGDPNERPGTMPGAINLPFHWLTENGNGRFPDRESLSSIFKETNVPIAGDQIYFCHTGHRASLSWFVSHELLNNSEARLYDGSMVEWAANPELPMVSKAKTDR